VKQLSLTHSLRHHVQPISRDYSLATTYGKSVFKVKYFRATKSS